MKILPLAAAVLCALCALPLTSSAKERRLRADIDLGDADAMSMESTETDLDFIQQPGATGSGGSASAPDGSDSGAAPWMGILEQVAQAAATDIESLLASAGVPELLQAVIDHANVEKPNPNAKWVCGWSNKSTEWGGWWSGSAKSAKSSKSAKSTDVDGWWPSPGTSTSTPNPTTPKPTTSPTPFPTGSPTSSPSQYCPSAIQADSLSCSKGPSPSPTSCTRCTGGGRPSDCNYANAGCACYDSGNGYCSNGFCMGGEFCRRRLRDGEEDPVKEDIPAEEVHEIINAMKDLGAKHDATFSFMYGLISKSSCDALIEDLELSLKADIASGVEMPVGGESDDGMMEEKHESWVPFHDGGIENQYNHKLYADDLVRMIGRDETLKIIDFFEESLGGLTIDCMYLARHGDPGEAQYMVPWHIDGYAAVEITLNKDYSGGHVLHLNGDGVHKTEARPGSATAHKDDIVHGITPNKGGAKYMLILKHHFNRPDKVGVVRLSREMVDEITNGSLETAFGYDAKN